MLKSDFVSEEAYEELDALYTSYRRDLGKVRKNGVPVVELELPIKCNLGQYINSVVRPCRFSHLQRREGEDVARRRVRGRPRTASLPVSRVRRPCVSPERPYQPPPRRPPKQLEPVAPAPQWATDVLAREAQRAEEVSAECRRRIRSGSAAAASATAAHRCANTDRAPPVPPKSQLDKQQLNTLVDHLYTRPLLLRKDKAATEAAEAAALREKERRVRDRTTLSHNQR